MSNLKLKHLKKILDKLSPEELDKPLLFNSEEFSISGEVTAFKKAKCNYYWDGEDDPSSLKTLSELKEEGYEKEEINSMEIEIKKGDFFIAL